MEKEIEKLKKKIEDLENRIKALETWKITHSHIARNIQSIPRTKRIIGKPLDQQWVPEVEY